MFNKTPATPTPPPAAPVSAPAGQEKRDIVIRTMPREFYGKEASLAEAPRRDSPVAPTPPTPPPAEVKPTVPKPVPPAQPKKRSKVGIILTVIVALLAIGGVAYGASILVERANKATEEAQKAAEDAAAKLEAEKEAAEEAARKAEEEAAKAAATPTPGKDTDSDGLTDVEELLYGTNFRDPDSDEDTYLDGNEVFHRYHPLGTAPATLLDTGAVKVFSDAEYPYSLYYPSTWTVALARDDLGVTFKSSRQATITVAWEEKSPEETLDDLLTGAISADDREDMKELLTKEGYYGLTSADDRTAYLDVGTAMVTLTYDLAGKAQIEYLQTFQMMVNSFMLVVEDTTQ